ncbi:glutamate-tRNA ligase [Kwoniella bestiolae CBS 10118]|uniref:Glutamate--tRNA ligase, mitochondrial n=1 Tax=Kwoniella bestiolae CBS 10118 TaxID=1296100 RepID=A0A1B9G9Q2_9TREE|nr:glutamate-tRNA ligase [Kwoniella bestiolae CBS 10118]OCF27765.1 glutamate-tRNA ligase [Kwoniella bestiolae CBS 10118]
MRTSTIPLIRAIFPRSTICKRCHSISTTPSSSSSTSSSSASSAVLSPRLRFAPSPTGHLHLGGLRTALFNHLLARKWKGKWLLRIEDTDRTRYTEGAVDSLRNSLEWAGLDYDEGVGVGGSHGPYTQSERLDIYHHYTKELLSRDEAYECFCSPNELEAIKASLKQQGQRHSYDGRCRHITDEEKVRKKKAGEKYVVRYKSSSQPMDIPPDVIFGENQPSAPTAGFDDFVLMKSDGWPTYHLASVVDDHLMEISHVLRGEEWLPSIPKHHSLYKAFGWTPPKFAHLPLLCNPDGTKLSKRKGDTFVEHYMNKGYEPPALINFLALMGWDYHSALSTKTTLDPHIRNDGHSLYELFTVDQLIDSFDISHIAHRKAAVNQSKLDFLNKMHLRRMAGRLGNDGVMVNAGKLSGLDEGEREGLVRRFQLGLRVEKALKGCELVEDIEFVEKVFDAELPRTTILTEMPMHSIFYFLPPTYECHESHSMLKDLKPRIYCQYVSLFADTLQQSASLSSTPLNEDLVWDVIHRLLDELNIDRKPRLLVPIRHALTERKKGPSIPELITILGLDESLSRLRRGVEYVRALDQSKKRKADEVE